MVAPEPIGGPHGVSLTEGRKEYIASWPQHLKHLGCTCEKAEPSFTRIHERGDFWVKVCCLRPANLAAYIFECDGCEQFYVAEFMPDEIMLCPTCRKLNDIELPDPDEWLEAKLNEQRMAYRRDTPYSRPAQD